MDKASAVGAAHNATITVVNGARTTPRRAALLAAEAKVTKLRAHLAGAEAEVARLRAEETN